MDNTGLRSNLVDLSHVIGELEDEIFELRYKNNDLKLNLISLCEVLEREADSIDADYVADLIKYIKDELINHLLKENE